MPDAELRLRLWRGVLGSDDRFDGVDLGGLAEDHVLSGGAIVNVVRYAAILAVSEGRESLTQSDLLEGVRRELQKEGRTL